MVGIWYDTKAEEVEDFQCGEKNPHSMKIGILNGLYKVIIIN